MAPLDLRDERGTVTGAQGEGEQMQGSWDSESPQGPENTGLMEGVTDKTKARCADK